METKHENKKINTDSCCTTYPHGTSLSEMMLMQRDKDTQDDSQYLSVVSFNVLAPLYVRPHDKRTGGIQPFAAFEWISEIDTPNVLDMGFLDRDQDGDEVAGTGRCVRLLELLRTCKADVICLQELQLERSRSGPDFSPSELSSINNLTDREKKDTLDFCLPSWIQPLIQKENYACIVPPQEELEIIAKRNERVLGAEVAVTCAILYRKDRLEKVKHENEGEDGDCNTCVSTCLRGLRANQNSVSIEPFVVSSVHLDAMDENKRVGQLSRCLKRARKLLTTERDGKLVLNNPISTIIAGDMNAEFFPGSCVSGFLHRQNMNLAEQEYERECSSGLRLSEDCQPTKAQLGKWIKLHADAKRTTEDLCLTLERINTGCTRSAFDHSKGAESDESRMGKWRLDHILHTTPSFQPCAIWSTLEDDPESSKVGLPNRHHGSDHIAIATLFKCHAAIPLSEVERASIVKTLRKVTFEQKRSLDELEAKFDRELHEIEKRIGIVSDQSTKISESRREKGAKKKKNDRPPIEIMEHLRGKRTEVKKLKSCHKRDRETLVSNLNNLQKLAIEQELGYSAYQWIERG